MSRFGMFRGLLAGDSFERIALLQFVLFFPLRLAAGLEAEDRPIESLLAC